ncbi:hypothetical protein D3C71_1468830 [compost metagenome]
MVVKFVPCAMLALGGHVEQPHGLTRLDPVATVGHGRADGALAARQHAAAPPGDGTRRARAAGALLAASIAEGVDDVADLPRVTFADLVQRQQRVVVERGHALHAVAGGTPAAPEVRPAPHAAGGFDERCLAGRAFTDEVEAAALGVAACQHGTGEGRGDRED